MNKYKISIYPIKTDIGSEWAAEFPSISGFSGGGDTPEEALKELFKAFETMKEVYLEEGINLPPEEIEE